jgi:AMMECR1 domain-containing protein
VLLPLLLTQDERIAEPWIALARGTIEQVVLGKPAPPPIAEAPARGVFVTIERDGTILGCRGTLGPTKKTLGDEIISAATGAAKFDPRYGPVPKSKLDRYLVTVTVVERLISVSSHEGLRPEEGLVLRSGSKTGVVLPWEGKDAAVRLSWAYRKAGVSPGTEITLMRLIGKRYRG